MPFCVRSRLEVSISERSAALGRRSPVARSTNAVSSGLGFRRSIHTASGIAALPRSAGACSVSPVRKWRVSIPPIVQALPLLGGKPFLRVLLAPVSGFPHPISRFAQIARNTPPVRVQRPDVVFGSGKSLVGGLAVPAHRLAVVLRHAPAVLVQQPDIVLGARISLVS